jgi:uncharacterized protein (UPF0276 family)
MNDPHARRPADAPDLGVGVGLRPTHYPDVLERAPQGRLQVSWFEAISDNYMVPGGRLPRVLEDVRRHAPVVLHGVSLNIGSTDPLNERYLDALDELVRRVEPAWVSDHLCWTGVSGQNLHDLLPLPYTEEAIAHVAGRIRQVQDRLARRIAIENVSSYMSYVADAVPEWEFLTAVAEAADCGILLDVNNVFVSSRNHGFSAEEYIDAIPPERVFQLHLAGHSDSGDLLIDTHDHPVCDEVWTLFERAYRRIGPVSTLIEWDDAIPDYDTLEAEAARARHLADAIAAAEWSHGTEQERAVAGGDPTAAIALDHGA